MSDYTVPVGQNYWVNSTDIYDTVYISSGASVLNVELGSVKTFEFLDNTGYLNTAGPPYWTGVIAGFQAGDVVTIQDVGNWTRYHYDDSTQTLKFLDGDGSITGYVHIAEPSPGYFNDGNISASGDPVLGEQFTNITTSVTSVGVPCFVRGTRILTSQGEIPVERLRVGDWVKTISGALKRIVWIGFGSNLVTTVNKLSRPIIVRRDALAQNVPHHDLHLTQGHKLYLDGVLIAVQHLVNHRSIVWDDTARCIEYYHVELEDHDVLLADGAPAESYYDDHNRAQFQNTREGSAPSSAAPTFAPILDCGYIVEKVWSDLFDRAGGPLEVETTEDPDIHLLRDGERLNPTHSEAGTCLFQVDPPAPITLHVCSRSGVPCLVGINHDNRVLGVAIKRVILAQAGMSICFGHDSRQLSEAGCHPPEANLCWTDGDLNLPARFFGCFDGSFTVRVDTEPHLMRYQICARKARAAA